MKLKELIEERRTVSYVQLCKAIGISRTELYNILSGKNIPTIPTIKKICNYFGVDWHEYI